MRSWLRSPFTFFTIWAGVLLCFVIVRPRPGSLVFTLFVVALFSAGAVHWLVSRRVSSESEREWAAWQARMDVLQVVIDIEDDGHLYEWLDPPQWAAAFTELERMPPTSRSLKAALQSVAPEVLYQ